jgi:pilus assembly protein CpaE
MLQGIIICPDEALSTKLEVATRATGEISIGRVLNFYPTGTDLSRAVREHALEMVFLSFDQLEDAREVVRFLEVEADGIQIIAIGHQMDQKLIREAMRVGVREFLAEPFTRQTLLETIAAVKGLVERKPSMRGSTNQTFAFLPAKPGAGASTIALNVSAAMARRPDTHVLLADFDLSSGLMRFMLKLENAYSVTDALQNAAHMDESLWPKMITTLDELSVLHSGCVNPSLCVETSQVRALIDFLRHKYQAVCFDLSGNMERYALEAMQDCKRILLVCTPEISSLQLAREKLFYLASCGLDARVSVILNRTQKKGAFSKEQSEEILGVPIRRCFPNHYVEVTRAIAAGSAVSPRTDLGEAFVQFSRELMEDRQIAESTANKRKFLEFFGIPRLGLAPREA